MNGTIEEVVRLLDEAKDKVLHLEMTQKQPKRPDKGVVMLVTLCGCTKHLDGGNEIPLKDRVSVCIDDNPMGPRYRVFCYHNWDHFLNAHIYKEKA